MAAPSIHASGQQIPTVAQRAWSALLTALTSLAPPRQNALTTTTAVAPPATRQSQPPPLTLHRLRSRNKSPAIRFDDPWSKRGAYLDEKGHGSNRRALPFAASPFKGHTVSTCAKACRKHRFFGLQMKTYCMCGDDWSRASRYGPGQCGETGAALCNFIYEHAVPLPMTHEHAVSIPMSHGGCVPDMSRLKWSGCAESNWEEVAATQLAERYPSPVLVNVGANKGYNAAAFMALHSQSGVTSRTWYRELLRYAKNDTGHTHKFLKSYPCGFCGDCHAPNPAPHSRNGGRVHLLELVEANRKLLRHLATRTGVGAKVFVHDLAASNNTYLEPQPSDPAGSETATLQPGKRSRKKRLQRSGGKFLHVGTLDDFFSREKLSDIYAVEIDTEGHDPLVLEGMRESVRARRVGFLKFEYSKRGFWVDERVHERRTLERTLSWLHQAGYTCFMEAAGALAPLSGKCWNATLERPHWSNVLCSHDQAGLGMLHDLSLQQYESRVRVPRRVHTDELRSAKGIR